MHPYEPVIPSIIPSVVLFQLDTFVYIIHYFHHTIVIRKVLPSHDCLRDCFGQGIPEELSFSPEGQ
jgi:hypothetical protein